MNKIKKILLIFVLLLTGCNSKKNFELCNQAFIEIESSYSKIEMITHDVLDMWKFSMNTKHKYELDRSFSYFLNNISVEETKIHSAITNVYYENWTDKSLGLDDYKGLVIQNPSAYFKRIIKNYNYNDIYKPIMMILIESYRVDDTIYLIEEELENVGNLLNEIDSKYEYYESLNQYYTLTKTYYDLLLIMDEIGHDVEFVGVKDSKDLYEMYKSKIQELEFNILEIYNSIQYNFSK